MKGQAKGVAFLVGDYPNIEDEEVTEVELECSLCHFEFKIKENQCIAIIMCGGCGNLLEYRDH